MRILLLCEGDAETRDAWSGSALSLVTELRRLGHVVTTVDVDLYGFLRLIAAVPVISLTRKAWAIRYRMSSLAFTLRSLLASRAVRHFAQDIDTVLQIGATFRPGNVESIPYCVYCDSNIRWAQLGAASGLSDASVLDSSTIDRIAAREHAVYERATKVFTLSDALRRSFIDQFGLPEGKVITIGAGPNMTVPDVAAQARVGSPDRPPTVLFVGKQFDRKGGPTLIRAFRMVRAELPTAELVIVGPPRQTSPEPGVRFMGFLSKDEDGGGEALSKVYASADVFCLPTRFEPFGIVFVEAMLFGLPCIGPNRWAVPEIIEDGVTGHTVDPDDEDAIAARLVELLTRPERARAMGKSGRVRALERFVWSSVAERMLHAI